MPRGDRTGPNGAGPLSGRGAGYCAGYDRPGFANPEFLPRGRGQGFGGGGRGRGYRNRYWQQWGGGRAYYGGPSYPQPPVAEPQFDESESEVGYLKRQTKHLQQSLKRMQERLAELEGSQD